MAIDYISSGNPSTQNPPVAAPSRPALCLDTKDSALFASVNGEWQPIASSGQNADFTGPFTSQQFNNVIIADQQSGADWGAKVNAAGALLGSTAGEIWISQAAGISAPAADITLSANHVLRFIQGGTFALGTKSIKITGSQAGIVGSNYTGLTYTGNGAAIDIGTSSTDTLRALVQGLVINTASAGSSAVAISAKRTWWPVFRDIEIIAANQATSLNGQTAISIDGTGGQTVFGLIENVTIAGNFTKGIVFANTANNSWTIIGGAIVASTNGIVTGNVALSFDKSSGSNKVLGLDIEGWDTGIYVNGDANWLNVRTELCNTNWLFDTGSRGNVLIGTYITGIDNGTFNSYQALPTAGQAQGTKLNNLTVGGATPVTLIVGATPIAEDISGGALALKNGTTSTQWKVYKSIIDINNYQYLSLTGTWAGGNPGIGVVGQGTLANGDLWLAPAGNGTLNFSTQGGVSRLDSTGKLTLIGSAVVGAAAPTTTAGQLGIGSTTAATASAGAATLPANPLGFLIMNLAGVTIKVPYYSA